MRIARTLVLTAALGIAAPVVADEKELPSQAIARIRNAETMDGRGHDMELFAAIELLQCIAAEYPDTPLADQLRRGGVPMFAGEPISPLSLSDQMRTLDMTTAQLEDVLGNAHPGEEVIIALEGPDFMSGATRVTTIRISVKEGYTSGAERLDNIGFKIEDRDGMIVVQEPIFGTRLATEVRDFDFYGSAPVQIVLVQTNDPDR